MKKILPCAALLFFFLLAIPALGLLLPGGKAPSSPEYPADGEQTLALLDEFSGDILNVSMRTYLVGALACELPSDFEPEALKAQVVACHTYALYMKLNGGNTELLGADFAVNTGQLRGYITEQQQRQLFKNSYASTVSALEQAVDEAYDYILTYSGEPIAAAWHAISCGVTESSADVFLSPLPYLVSVDSACDSASPNFTSEASCTLQELYDLLCTADEQLVLEGEPDGWFEVLTQTESGTVSSIKAGNRTYTGEQFCRNAGLRSACFTWEIDDGEIVFYVRGFGHGVGMSQYGANCRAKNGETFDLILAHYYPGATLSVYAG